jgi:uncharacterized protein (TIGR00369 family)
MPHRPVAANEVRQMRPLPHDPGEWAAWADDLPASLAMALRAVAIEPGHAHVALDRSIWPLNPNGSVHGGLVLAVADHVGGMAAMTVMPPGEYCATATLASQFQRPAVLPLMFEASVTRSGRTLAFVELTVSSGDGRRCASVVGTWSLNLLAAAGIGGERR